MKTLLLAGCCLLCFTSGRTQTRGIEIDSVLQILRAHAVQDTQHVNLLVTITRLYLGNDNNKTFLYGAKALKLADSLNFLRGKVMAHNALGMANQLASNNQQGLYHVMQALALCEQTGQLVEKGEGSRILANIYLNLGEPDKAKPYYQQAIRWANLSGDKTLLTKAYCAIGIWYYQNNFPDSASHYLKHSLQLTEKYKNAHFKPHILSQLGWINRETNPTLAIAYEHQAVEAARAAQNYAAEATALADLGTLYIEANDYKHADQYLTEALKAMAGKNITTQQSHIYHELLDVKIKQGKLDEVRKYVDAYLASRDSVLNEKKAKQIAEVEARFQNEKNAQTIKILEQEKEIEILWKESLVLVAVVLLLFGAAIFRLQRLRNKKAAQLLETQKQLNEKLQEADSMRSAFFASISHEFRTPITLILAPLEEKVKSPTLSARDREDLQLVIRNAHRLAELVNQILDLSKLEAGKMEVQWQDGNLATFFTPLLGSFDSLAQSRGIVYHQELMVADRACKFDADKLEKIVSNLLSNAFKFTPQGGTVRARIEASFDNAKLLIRIADTGKGIAEEDLANIFTPFFQSGTMENTALPGTGLGLALVQELVKVYGGTIRVSSRLDEGTSIDVLLPLALSAVPSGAAQITLSSRLPMEYTPVEMKAEPAAEESFTEALLIVEDNQELRSFIGEHFKTSFNIYTATNGKEALAIATERMPSLIISDVMMPEMDGVEFMKRIKADERTNHIPVILLTARAGQEEKLAALQLGSEEYLAKPFSIRELDTRVVSIIENRKKVAAYYKRIFQLSTTALPDAKPVASISVNAKFIDKLTACIHQHVGDTGFSVEKLAEEMCLSRAQLFRKVKMVLDTSPSDLISDIRLQLAARLIETNADTLAQIAYTVGFSEQSYFSKRFRKKFGVSPTEYSEGIRASA